MRRKAEDANKVQEENAKNSIEKRRQKDRSKEKAELLEEAGHMLTPLLVSILLVVRSFRLLFSMEFSAFSSCALSASSASLLTIELSV